MSYYVKKDASNNVLDIDARHNNGVYYISIQKGQEGQSGGNFSSFTTVIFQDFSKSYSLAKGRKSSKKINLLNDYVKALFNHTQSLADTLDFDDHTMLDNFFTDYIKNNPITF